MNINIRTIPHKNQRYPTAGDWYDIDGQTEIRVSDIGNEDMEFCIAIHEAVEQYLCRKRLISDECVTEFDKQHLDHLNPGDLHDAPYHQEHMVASVIELLLLKELNVNLQEYDRKLEEL